MYPYTTATLVYTATAAPSVSPSLLEQLIRNAEIAPDITGFLNPLWGITLSLASNTTLVGTLVTRTVVLNLTPEYNESFPEGDFSLFVERYAGVLSQNARCPVISAGPLLS